MSAMNHHKLRQPAEWAEHTACWLAWPSHEDLWLDNIGPAREEFAALCRAIAADGGEKLEILVPDKRQRSLAEGALQGLAARFHEIPFGDIWLRDTAPIFMRQADGKLLAARFGFNGWGGKYVLEHDDRVSARIAEVSGVASRLFPMILEGGAMEVDGEGTALTTRQCLLNPNRNPAMSQPAIEAVLKESFGLEKILWLGDGLVNDHTDGHIDTIARFVAPGVAICMEARSKDDPNAEILAKIASDLESFTDAKGRKLRVVRIPSPGRLENEEGRVMPASYVNFYIGNRTVVVPTYGTKHDAEAVAAIAKCFPGRKTVGCSAKAILSGGGAFHCITQQVPK